MGEHYRCNSIEWDPSGRIVATAVMQPLEGAFFKYQMDNGFKLWTFQGKQYHETSYENFYQFTWRPRPSSLLDAEQRATRKALRDLIKLRSANYAAGSAARMRMRNGVDADADDLYVISTRTIESVVRTKEEVVN